MTLRIALFGQAPFGRDVAVRLAEAGHELVAVHVPPDKGGRADPLAEESGERGWSLYRHKAYRRQGVAMPERVAEYLVEEGKGAGGADAWRLKQAGIDAARRTATYKEEVGKKSQE